MIRVLAGWFLLWGLGSCSGEAYYEKDFYERTSGIYLPQSAKAIESFDNGEFVTTTVFRLDSTELLDLIRKHSFTLAEKPLMFGLFGITHLKANRIDPEKLVNVYYKAGTTGKNSWLYFTDLKSKKLWAEILYPDWAGN